MDSSEQYIKMCSKASEIQKLWKQNKGEYVAVYSSEWEYFDKDYQVRNKIVILGVDGNYVTDESLCVWLPRQDQLQEIMEIDIRSVCSFIILDQLMDRYITRYGYLLETMEQLWLAFFMLEKYKKHWDNKLQKSITLLRLIVNVSPVILMGDML